jgi:NAD(P) transhydrogenase subunit beta
MEDINGDFGAADIAFVLGANDVVNPLAEQKGSPIYGMPILDVDRSGTVVVLKRSMSPGFAGVDNPLFVGPNTMMLFGDAKQSVAGLAAAVKTL